MRTEKRVRIWECLVDGENSFLDGEPLGMGDTVRRFRYQEDAVNFCRGKFHHGQPAYASSSVVPKSAAERYGCY